MDQEKKEDLINALHNKGKLPSLRTYQGDMANFIRSKNESVISIAVKEKEREEEKRKEQKKLVSTPILKSNNDGFQINVTIIILSLLLLFGGAVTFFYVFEFTSRKPVTKFSEDAQIIPYNYKNTILNSSSLTFKDQFLKMPFQNGVSIAIVSDISGTSFPKAHDFFNFIKVLPPSTLLRTMKAPYILGTLGQNGSRTNFIILSAGDFGQAFAGMLEWETNLPKDLSFLGVDLATNSYFWRDMIVKNKDVRVLTNEAEDVKIAYTFLDRDTILITNNLDTIGDISNLYTTRAVSR